MMEAISPQILRDWILDGSELAILDAREEGEFGRHHLFWAVCCALSVKELQVGQILPCTSTRIVCTDDGGGEAQTLAAYLEDAGYDSVFVLKGGVQAWADAGYVLFSGVNVPSKAFGEWVEHHYGTESVDPPELAAWLEEGRNMVLLDSRTFDEFKLRTLPASMNVPGGELVYRIGDLAPDPQTLVVVHCAGRTRSIMGAESLRRVGIPNRVVALRNGTMGWELSGLVCDRGRQARFTAGRPQSEALARERADAFARRSGVRVLNRPELDRLKTQAGRTLYLLDVREPAEYLAGHFPGSQSAPGGQLLQATDEWIAVRNCRIVLFDDDGVRGRMVAAWLRHMAYKEVFVFDTAGEVQRATAGPWPQPALPSVPASVPDIAPSALADLMAKGSVLVVDLARSIDFRDGHVPGARWSMRRDLPGLIAELEPRLTVVVTSPDGVIAHLAVADLPAEQLSRVRLLAGGTRGWVSAGLSLGADRTVPADEACLDVYLRPYDRNSGLDEAISEYLTWEIDLIHEVERDGTVDFRTP